MRPHAFPAGAAVPCSASMRGKREQGGGRRGGGGRRDEGQECHNHDDCSICCAMCYHADALRHALHCYDVRRVKCCHAATRG